MIKIVVKGGCVQEIIAPYPVEALIIDLDIEGADEDRLETISLDGEAITALTGIMSARGEEMPKSTSIDLMTENHGTIYLLRPLTDAGKRWIDERLDPEAQRLGAAVAIEHRYIEDIVAGARAEGLKVN